VNGTACDTGGTLFDIGSFGYNETPDMSGFLLTTDSAVTCQHGGSVLNQLPQPRVLVSGSPVLPEPGLGIVSGCPFQPLSGSGPTGKTHTITGPLPCMTAEWVTATTRVHSNGEPLLLDTSEAVTSPGGGSVAITVIQQRVRAK
jgi:hypothetical protein